MLIFKKQLLNQVSIRSGKMAELEQKKELLAFIFDIKKAYLRASFADVVKRDTVQFSALLREIQSQIEIQYQNKELLLPDFRDFSLEIELVSAETFKAKNAAIEARSRLQKLSSYHAKPDGEFPSIENDLRQWLVSLSKLQASTFKKSLEEQSLDEEREWTELKLRYFESKRFPWIGFFEVGHPLDDLSTVIVTQEPVLFEAYFKV
jgi:hypothetical protein